MNLRQAAQQALEFLSHDMVAEDWPHQKRKDAICDALRAALAEPEQEPVAWMWRCKPFCNWPEWSVSLKRPADSGHDGNKRTEGYEDVPLYTAPTPQPEQKSWFTVEELNEFATKLKEKAWKA